MAKILSKTGIISGQPVQAHHVSQSIDALTGIVAYDIDISGSLGIIGSASFEGEMDVDGNILTTGRVSASSATIAGLIYPLSDDSEGRPLVTNGAGEIIFTGSIDVTASYAHNSLSASVATLAADATTASYALTADSAESASFASFVLSASFVETASYVSASSVDGIVTSASYAITASYAENTISASYVTGSNVYGPHGSNSVISASHALTASYLEGAALTSSAFDGTGSGVFTGSFSGTGYGLTDLRAPGIQGQIMINNNHCRISQANALRYDTGSCGLAIGFNGIASTTLDVAGRITQRAINNSTALGFCTLNDATTGVRNIAIGNYSLSGSLTADNNVAIGYNALCRNITGDNNVAIGNNALLSGDCNGNTAIGATALQNANLSSRNIAIGQCAGIFSTEIDDNVFIGFRAAANACTATDNVSIGNQSLRYLSTGDDNIAIGRHALCQITTGCQNTIIGSCAGRTLQNASVGNVIIGYNAGPSNNQIWENQLYINNGLGEALVEGKFGPASQACLNIRGALTASGLNYPTVDGVSGSLLATDGSGNIRFSNVNVSSIEAATSQSVTQVTYDDSNDTFTFTRANGTTIAIQHNTGSGGSGGTGISSTDLDHISSSFFSASGHGNTISFFDLSGSNIGDVTLASASGIMQTDIDPLISGAVASGNTITFTREDGTTFDVSVGSSTLNTGSFFTGSAIAGNVISFRKGDGSTETLTLPAGGGSNDLLNLSSSITRVVGGTLGDVVSFRSGSTILTDAEFRVVTASFAHNASTASYVENAVSSSYATTASHAINVASASHANFAVTASYMMNTNIANTHTQSFSGVTSVVVQHNFGTRYNAVTVYDSLGEVMIPERIVSVDENSTRVYFSTTQTGTVAITNGGRLSGSAGSGVTNIQYQVYTTGSGLYSIQPKNGANDNLGTYALIGGGNMNCVDTSYSTVINGCNNRVTGTYSTLNNGRNNCIDVASFAYLGGGQDNCIDQGNHSYIGGGQNNTIGDNAEHSIIVGGCRNSVCSDQAGVLGGYNNLIRHDNSFAIGSNLTSSKEFTLYINNLDVSGNIDMSSGSAGLFSLPGFPDVSASLAEALNSSGSGNSLITASVMASTITFTKGNGETFDIVVAQSGSVESSSYAEYAVSSSVADSASTATSSSFADTAISSSYATTSSYALDAISASYATTSSYTLDGYISSSVALNRITLVKGDGTTDSITVHTGSGGGGLADLEGTGVISGSAQIAELAAGILSSSAQVTLPDGLVSGSTQVVNLLNGQDVVLGEVSATSITTEIISSSIILTTGSNIFGDQSTDKHEFTGSVNFSSSISIPGFSDLSASLAAISESAASGGGGLADLDGTGAISSSAQIATDISGAFAGVTGSFFTGSAIAGDVITFHKGDGTTETITIPAGLRTGSSYIHTQSAASTTWVVDHDFGEQYPAVTVYNSSDEVVIPDSIAATNANRTTITFTSAQSGHATITLGGSGSAGGGGLADLEGTEVISGSSQIAELGANIVSGSGFISASIGVGANLNNQITFNQADGSTLSYIIATGSGGGLADLEGTGVISGSAQIATDISGAFDNVSASLASDISTALSIDTGSFFTGSVANGNTITFRKADGTDEDLVLPNGLRTGSSYIHTQSSAATTWTVAHTFGERYPAVTVYDGSDRIIVPAEIEAIDQDTIEVSFTSPQSGHATITLGGSGSAAGSNLSITNAANDRIVTSNGGNGLNAEANLTFNGTTFGIPGFPDVSASLADALSGSGLSNLEGTNVVSGAAQLVDPLAAQQVVYGASSTALTSSDGFTFDLANRTLYVSGSNSGGEYGNVVADRFTAPNSTIGAQTHLWWPDSQSMHLTVDGTRYMSINSRHASSEVIFNQSQEQDAHVRIAAEKQDYLLYARTVASGSINIGTQLNPNNRILNVDGDVEATTYYGDGSNLTGLDFLRTGSSYIHTQSSAALTWTINHNFGEQYPAVTVYDSSDQVAIPSTVEATDSNTTTVTFTSPMSGHATITLGGTGSAAATDFNGTGIVSGSAQISELTTWTGSFSTTSSMIAEHNLGVRMVLVQTFDENYNMFVPDNIQLSSSNGVLIDFGTNKSGHVIIKR